MPHEPPERIKHVFEFYDLESEFTPERAEMLKDGSGLVYLIQCNEFVKIGIAENVDSRLAYLQVGNPYELRLLKAFRSETPVEDEERLQNRLARYHERGEWYLLPQSVVDALLRLEHLSSVHEWRSTDQRTDCLGELPPRIESYKFTVRFLGKIVYSGRAVKTSANGPTYVRPSRSNAIPLADQKPVEEAIKTFRTVIETDLNTYNIQFGKGVPTTKSNATSN